MRISWYIWLYIQETSLNINKYVNCSPYCAMNNVPIRVYKLRRIDRPLVCEYDVDHVLHLFRGTR